MRRKSFLRDPNPCGNLKILFIQTVSSVNCLKFLGVVLFLLERSRQIKIRFYAIQIIVSVFYGEHFYFTKLFNTEFLFCFVCSLARLYASE